MTENRHSRWFTASLAVIAASRLLAIPGVPWEQDEALFAAASFSVDLVAHRPHPPGFPLWVGVGALGRVIFGDPLVVLQIVSALASIVTVVLLARLWSAGLGSRPLGEAAAVLFAFLPAVWFHAPRAFSTTPALTLACAGCALLLTPGRRPLVLAATLLAGAALTRPILVPLLALVALAATLLRRDAARDRAIAAAVGIAVTVAGFAPLVVATGGWDRFVASLAEHGATHAGALHLGSWQPTRLGLVRALGGLPSAVLALALFTVGWAGWRRRQPRVALWGLAVMAWTVGWLLLAHNRTYPRYTLPALALLVGPVVGGLELLLGGQRRALTAALMLAAVSAAWTAPAVWTQATAAFPPLAALAAAEASPSARAVMVDGALSPFTDLRALARRGRLPAYWRPLVAEGRIPLETIPGPWVLVGAAGTPIGWLPPAWPPPAQQRIEAPRLAALAQDRFLEAWTSEGGALVLDPRWPVLDPDGALALNIPVRLLAEPAPPGSVLGGVVESASAAWLVIEPTGGRATRTELPPGSSVLAIPAEGPAGRPLELRIAVEGAAGVRLKRLWIDRPDRSPAPVRLAPSDQDDGLGGLIRGAGFHGVEPGLPLPGGGGRWTAAAARLELPAACGLLELDLAAPRPAPATVRVACPEAGFVADVTVGPVPLTVRVPLPKALARVTVTIDVSDPFVPAELDSASADRRTLGVVLGEIRRR